jgi:hypothetical protein
LRKDARFNFFFMVEDLTLWRSVPISHCIIGRPVGQSHAVLEIFFSSTSTEVGLDETRHFVESRRLARGIYASCEALS